MIKWRKTAFPFLNGEEFLIGTVRGMAIREKAECIIYAIVNDYPHNGDFSKAVSIFESAFDRVIVLCFFSDRLRNWYLRRGYESAPHEMGPDAVEYRKRVNLHSGAGFFV